MLEAENLYKNYKIRSGSKNHFFEKKEIKTIEAVKNISLNIEPGEIIGLLGINGAGKTTVIKMLTTLIAPTSGIITIDGIDAVKDHLEAKKIINLITGGERNIYWRLSAKENLEYFGSLYGINKRELACRIENVLKIVQLDDVKDIPVEKYSKGMKQRLQIARGLINDPRYIFLDEPTLGLDIVIAKELRKYVYGLAKMHNKGILITTHYMLEADELCDFIYVINKGKIIAKGAPKDIKQQYTTTSKCRFFVYSINDDLLKGLESIKREYIGFTFDIDQEKQMIEIISFDDISSYVLQLIDKSGAKLINMIKLEPSLEDALFEVIKENNNE